MQTGKISNSSKWVTGYSNHILVTKSHWFQSWPDVEPTSLKCRGLDTFTFFLDKYEVLASKILIWRALCKCSLEMMYFQNKFISISKQEKVYKQIYLLTPQNKHLVLHTYRSFCPRAFMNLAFLCTKKKTSDLLRLLIMIEGYTYPVFSYFWEVYLPISLMDEITVLWFQLLKVKELIIVQTLD